jgi:ELWxxDGT repeat protein
VRPAVFRTRRLPNAHSVRRQALLLGEDTARLFKTDGTETGRTNVYMAPSMATWTARSTSFPGPQGRRLRTVWRSTERRARTARRAFRPRPAMRSTACRAGSIFSRSEASWHRRDGRRDHLPPDDDVNPESSRRGRLHFRRPAYGRELWRNNGTPAGTYMVADLNRSHRTACRTAQTRTGHHNSATDGRDFELGRATARSRTVLGATSIDRRHGPSYFRRSAKYSYYGQTRASATSPRSDSTAKAPRCPQRTSSLEHPESPANVGGTSSSMPTRPLAAALALESPADDTSDRRLDGTRRIDHRPPRADDVVDAPARTATHRRRRQRRRISEACCTTWACSPWDRSG